MTTSRTRITALLAIVVLGCVGFALWNPSSGSELIRAQGAEPIAEDDPASELTLNAQDLDQPPRDPDPSEVREEVPLTGHIEGVVTMHSGEALPGFELLLQSNFTRIEATTDGKGRYRSGPLRPGMYIVTAYLLENPLPRFATVVAGETTHVPIRALPNSCYIWGIVTRNGVLQVNRKVTLQGRDDQGAPCFMPLMTDEHGTYRIVARHGQYSIGVARGPGAFLVSYGVGDWHPRGDGPVATWEMLELDANSPTVIRLDLAVPPSSVNLLVLNVNDGSPIADARVSLTRQGAALPPYSSPRAITTTDDAGRIEFNDLPFGTYDVLVEASGFAAPELPALVIERSRMRHDLVVELATGGTFEVELLNEAGETLTPPDRFSFTATNEDSGHTRFISTQTTRLGSPYLQADHVALGTWSFEVRDEVHPEGIEFARYDPAGPFHVEVLPDERSTLKLQGLRERGRLTIETIQASGLVIRDAEIEVWTVDTNPTRALLEHWDDASIRSSGLFLPPGEYRIVVDWRGRRIERTVTMTRDTTAEWVAFD
tara:strand:+ start:524 stop:2149 length:1626 start_codon:yes stop_codon:yes gene_type:complete